MLSLFFSLRKREDLFLVFYGQTFFNKVDKLINVTSRNTCNNPYCVCDGCNTNTEFSSVIVKLRSGDRIGGDFLVGVMACFLSVH